MNPARIRPRHALSVLLAAAILACSLWIGRMLERGGAAAPGGPERPARQEVPLRLLPDYSLLGSGQTLTETTARPLFNPSRRAKPVSDGATEPKPEGLPRGRFSLVGVSILPDRRVALLRDLAADKLVHVEQNATLDGILVASVMPTKVILRQRGEQEELPLKIAPAPKPPEPSPPPTQGKPAGQASGAQEMEPPAIPIPAVEPPTGPRQAAEDIANADPITEQDLIEAEERRRARRARRAAAGGGTPQ